MNKELVTRILIQLEPNLAQEFGLAIAEDEKKLKALEIIIKKNVKIDVLKYQSDVVFYNMAVFEKEDKLTKEEFILLKKVLLCD